MKTITSRMARGLPALALPLLLLAFAPASAVLVDIGSYAGTVGDTLDVTLDVEDLTGLGVVSWETEIHWTGDTYLTLIDVVDTGSLAAAAGWGPPVWSTTGPSVAIAAAGTSALAGAGNVVTLRFELGPSSGSRSLVFDSFVFNEGTPIATTSNGSISISALPTITVSPNTGEILVTETLGFFVSGGTGPYTWGTTDAGVATIDGGGILTGVSPGSVQVWAEDANAVRDSTGTILVRAMRLSVPDGLSAPRGATLQIPVQVTDLTGLGIGSYQFELTYTASRLVATGITVAGTITQTAGWSAPQFSIEAGRIRVAAAGTSPLAGAGTLLYLDMVVPLDASSSTNLTLGDALFDEQYVPQIDNGSFSVILPSTITVSPNTASVLIPATQQFTLSGSPTPPVNWSTTDPAVGTMDATGLFTPVAGGQCRIVAQDAIGAVDSSGVIDVYDFSVRVPANATVQTLVPTTAIPVTVDRDLGPLGIWGYEITLSFNGDVVNAIAATDSGGVTSSWGAPTYHVYPDSIKIAHAGSAPLAGGPGPLLHIYFQPDPGATPGQTTAFTFRKALFNEGSPRAQALDGILRVDDTLTSVLDPLALGGLQLAQNRPNPLRDGTTTIQFSVVRDVAGDLALTILDPAGRVVRRWDLAGADRGPHAIVWDGRDGRGSQVASGVYFYRLAGGGEERVRKLVVLR
jgi:hypothetical protein